MDERLLKILQKLDRWIELTNEQSFDESFLFKPSCKITILGQMGLLIDSEVVISLSPMATIDLDAWIKADIQIITKIKELLNEDGLFLDELSNEIWLPKEYETDIFFTSDRITCLKVKPLYLLVSKAIKAKEKNRVLVKEAMGIYRDELVDLIVKYGGDPMYFIKDQS